MRLTLSIDGMDELDGGLPARAELDEHGLFIGRSPHSDWCLPDPRNQISSNHCEVDWRDGDYWLTDTSMNGTFINGVDRRRQPPHRLANGDKITIGHYRLRVELYGAPAARRDAPEPAGGIWPGLGPAVAPPPPVAARSEDDWDHLPPPAVRRAALPGLDGGLSLDAPGLPAEDLAPGRRPSILPGLDTGEPPPPPYDPPRPAPGPPRDDPFAAFLQANQIDFRDLSRHDERPPSPPDNPAPLYVPGGQAPTLPDAQHADAAPAAPTAPRKPSDGELAWVAFLLAAGIDPADLTTEPAAAGSMAGQAFADLTAGLVMMLNKRAEAKEQMGAPGTTISLHGNNPLKFAIDPTRTTTQLINPPARGFMPADKAIEDAFRDLQAHQMALLAAMQQALRSTLDRFSPRAIRARATATGLARILPGAQHAALWQAYEREFDGVVEGSDEAFLDLFARAFQRAYEDYSR